MVYQTNTPGNAPGILGYATEPTRNEKQTIGTTSTLICEKRNQTNERKVLIIRNTSDADNKIITIAIGNEQATAQNGIVLNRNEAFTDTTETGYKCFQGQISGICEVEGGKFSKFEGKKKMGFSFSGTAITISGSVNVALPSNNDNQTIVTERFEHNGNNAYQTAYTVTTGKTLYLFGVWVQNATGCNNVLGDNSDNALITFITTAGAEENLHLSTATPLAVYTSGQTVRVKSAAGAGNWYLVGYEE